MIAWSYVMTSDSGKAPNYEGPAATLAICKPSIRRGAAPGDLVIGFSGAPFRSHPHGVRWAGVVTEVIGFDAYWSDSRFAGKKPGRSATPDNIYAFEDGRLVQVPNRSHGPGDMMTDLSGNNVLVFGRSWRFGDAAPVMPDELGLRMPLNARRGQRRRDLSPGEWMEIEAWLEAQKPAAALLLPAAGRPCSVRPQPRTKSSC